MNMEDIFIQDGIQKSVGRLKYSLNFSNRRIIWYFPVISRLGDGETFKSKFCTLNFPFPENKGKNASEVLSNNNSEID